MEIITKTIERFSVSKEELLNLLDDSREDCQVRIYFVIPYSGNFSSNEQVDIEDNSIVIEKTFLQKETIEKS